MSFPGPEPAEVRNVFRTMWWVVLIRGLLMAAFGIFMIVWPEPVLVAFVWLFGVYAILDGVASLVHAWKSKSGIGMGAGLGVVSVVAGLVALIWPGATAVVILMIVAVWIILLGIIQISAGIGVRSVPQSGWGWLVASGALSLVLGFLLIAAPGGGLLAILTFYGAMTALAGVALVVASLVARRFVKQTI